MVVEEMIQKASDAVSGVMQQMNISSPTDSSPIAHVDDATGSDEKGTGSPDHPFKTTLQALIAHSGECRLYTFSPNAAGVKEWSPISSSGEKKAKKMFEEKQKKIEKEKLAAVEKQKAFQALLEQSKKIILVDDVETHGKATKCKIHATSEFRGKRVVIYGWVHRLRAQKANTFITLRDGTGYLQAILSGDCAKIHDALILSTEASVALTGTLQAVPEGKSAPGGHELIVDYWHIVGKAPMGEDVDTFSSKFNEQSDPSVLADLRHLVLRTETASSVMQVRAATLASFRSAYAKNHILEVTPPCMVQTQSEGGGTLFKFDYYGQDAYLTQSSQLYLETCLPGLGDVYCVQESFRAEQSLTRRHLSEYTHIEAELAFITFDELMTHIEQMVCDTVDTLLADPKMAATIKHLNPSFEAPKRPFMRMDYRAAIQYLNEHNILVPADEETGEPARPHKDGDDIAEAAERQMTDNLGVPMFLCRFPRHIKAFYMKRCPEDLEYTESCDLLMPNVGEIVGGSMRITDSDELLAAYKTEGIDHSPYYWFTDQRKYGTCEHGGYGLGLETIGVDDWKIYCQGLLTVPQMVKAMHSLRHENAPFILYTATVVKLVRYIAEYFVNIRD